MNKKKKAMDEVPMLEFFVKEFYPICDHLTVNIGNRDGTKGITIRCGHYEEGSMIFSEGKREETKWNKEKDQVL